MGKELWQLTPSRLWLEWPLSGAVERTEKLSLPCGCSLGLARLPAGLSSRHYLYPTWCPSARDPWLATAQGFAWFFHNIVLLWCLPQKRSVEDLKERYYHICAKLANIRAAPGTDLKIPVFDAGHERRRKEQLERLYNRTPEQVTWEGEHLCSRKFMLSWISR